MFITPGGLFEFGPYFSLKFQSDITVSLPSITPAALYEYGDYSSRSSAACLSDCQCSHRCSGGSPRGTHHFHEYAQVVRPAPYRSLRKDGGDLPADAYYYRRNGKVAYRHGFVSYVTRRVRLLDLLML